ncbi:hypothetical protein SMITH_280 [Smithella sp. ME-1]|nr:hypothetical protein SMITH_280 [Smithella sp. ME-1]
MSTKIIKIINNLSLFFLLIFYLAVIIGKVTEVTSLRSCTT